MKNIALVAHDNKKDDIVEWRDFNKGTLPNIVCMLLELPEKELWRVQVWKLICLRVALRRRHAAGRFNC